MTLNNNTQKIKRIIIHHTAGTYKANSTDLEAYHYVVEGNGTIVKGKHSIEDNIDCTDGNYAAHTLKGNTGSIGVAMACNKGFNKHCMNACSFPITNLQYKSMIDLCASLMLKYNIDINQIWTHYEWDKVHKINQGKVDIIYLPMYNTLKPEDILRRIKADILKARCKLL